MASFKQFMNNLATSDKIHASAMICLQKQYHESDVEKPLMKVLKQEFPKHYKQIEILNIEFDGTGTSFVVGGRDYFWVIECLVPKAIATDDFWMDYE